MAKRRKNKKQTSTHSASNNRHYVIIDGEKVLLSLNTDPVQKIMHAPFFTAQRETVPTTTLIDPPGEPDRFASVVDNVFSQKQCDELIAFSEHFEWGRFGTSYRKELCRGRSVWRILVDCPPLADQIFSLVKPHLPDTFNGNSIVGFNCRFRFLKYHKDMFHNDHRDSFYQDPVTGHRTQITVMIYLSASCEGGATLLLDPSKKKKPLRVVPETGRILIFEHRVFHSGDSLLNGEKRALRMDVLYTSPSLSQKGGKAKDTSKWKNWTCNKCNTFNDKMNTKCSKCGAKFTATYLPEKKRRRKDRKSRRKSRLSEFERFGKGNPI